jgi:hypothetical protein
MFLAICAFKTLSICVLTFFKSSAYFTALLYGEMKLPTCNKSAHLTLSLTLFQVLKPLIVCQRTISTQKLKLSGEVPGYDLYYSLTHPLK